MSVGVGSPSVLILHLFINIVKRPILVHTDFVSVYNELLLCERNLTMYTISFLFLKNYLFIYVFWLCWGLVAAHGIFTHGMWTLKSSMWDLVPDRGSNRGPLHWECGVLGTEPAEKSLYAISYYVIFLQATYKTDLFSLFLKLPSSLWSQNTYFI